MLEVAERALFAGKRHFQRVPRRHQVMRVAEVGLFRTLALTPFRQLAGSLGNSLETVGKSPKFVRVADRVQTRISIL